MANAQFGAPIPLLGIEGPQGLQGVPGFSVLAGNGVPQPDFGSVGDVFISLDEGLLYAPKTSSGWPSATRSLIGPQGALGNVGPSGAALLNGYGAPADSLGTDGDSYFNAQNGAIYGPKDKGHWPTSFTSLIGPAGSQGEVGTLILAASGGPNDSQGSDGDFFVDTLDGRFYGPKDQGSWGNGFSLIGPMGSTGARGVQGLAGADGASILQGTGAPSSQGKPGDFYFDSDSSTFYGPRGNAVNSPWPPQGFSVRGDVGPQGIQGPGGMMGADGKTLRSGAGDPSDGLGDDGDFYFNVATGYLVGPKDGGKWPLPGFLLKGPSGDRGDVGPSGPQGIQGPGILSGGGAPAASLGTDGSFYIDGQAFVLYGPKDSSNQNPWFKFRNIVGPQGPAGQDSQVPGPQGIAGPRGFSVQSGQGAPPSTLGNDGDLYVDLAGPNLYGAKTSGAWPTTFEPLAGARGPAGADSTVPGPSGPMGYSLLTGSGAPSSSYGNNGDAYLDLDAGALYGAKANGVWPTKFKSLIGASGQTGAQGAPGAAGSNGTILRYGNGAPTGQTAANDGDFYIDQTASRLYGPRTNGSFPSSSVSLVGPTGANGALIITGNGPPANGIGTLGDVYLDLTAGNLYGNKTSSGWPSTFTSLVGPAGTQGVAGSTIQTGQGTPANSQGNVGDIYVDLQGGNLFGPKTSSGWPTAYTSLLGPAGPRGPAGQDSTVPGPQGVRGYRGYAVQSGQGAPASSLGMDGDVYLDLQNGYLYGAKANGSWPTTYTSLIGPQGSQGVQGVQGVRAPGVFSGTTAPTQSASYIAGDFYLNTSTEGLYGPYSTSSGWGSPTSLIGPQGIQGVQGVMGYAVRSGTGGPSASKPAAQQDGDFYIDTQANALYGPRASGAWPSTPVNLVGPQGVQGSPGTSLRNGTGAPTTSPANPATQQDGDFYIDTAAQVLYGPRASGVWPTSGVPTGGTIIRQSAGYPQTTLGNIGDYAIDTTQGFLYGPKTSANGWSASAPISIVGPTGPSGQVQPAFGTFSNAFGPAVYWTGTLNNTGQNGNPAGFTAQNYFVPLTNSAYMGAQVVNFGSSPSSCLWQLYNNTTSTVVFTGPSVAVGTVTTYAAQASTAYPLVAGQSYSWRIYGSGSGFSSYIVPQYMAMCGASQGVSTFATFVQPSITLSGTAQNMQPPGIAGQTQYYRNNTAGYLYSMQVSVTGTISANVTFGGYTTTAVTAANSPQVFGPFVAASNSLAAATNYIATTTGSGTGAVVMIPTIVS